MYWMSSSIFMVDVREVLVATVPFVQVDIFHSSSEARYGVRVAGQDVDGTQLRKCHKDIRDLITQLVSFWGCVVVVVSCICIQARC